MPAATMIRIEVMLPVGNPNIQAALDQFTSSILTSGGNYEVHQIHNVAQGWSMSNAFLLVIHVPPGQDVGILNSVSALNTNNSLGVPVHARSMSVTRTT